MNFAESTQRLNWLFTPEQLVSYDRKLTGAAQAFLQANSSPCSAPHPTAEAAARGEPAAQPDRAAAGARRDGGRQDLLPPPPAAHRCRLALPHRLGLPAHRPPPWIPATHRQQASDQGSAVWLPAVFTWWAALVLCRCRVFTPSRLPHPHRAEAAPEAPSGEEERALLKFYGTKLQHACRELRLPRRVLGTAVTYLKRVYLSHSCLDHDPQQLLLSCLYLACKVGASAGSGVMVCGCGCGWGGGGGVVMGWWQARTLAPPRCALPTSAAHSAPPYCHHAL